MPAVAAGVQTERTVMVDAHNAARVAFEGVRVPASAIIGTPETGAALLEQLLDVGRAIAAAEMLGLADEVFERTVAYPKEQACRCTAASASPTNWTWASS